MGLYLFYGWIIFHSVYSWLLNNIGIMGTDPHTVVNLYIVLPWYLCGIGFRLATDTKICGCQVPQLVLQIHGSICEDSTNHAFCSTYCICVCVYRSHIFIHSSAYNTGFSMSCLQGTWGCKHIFKIAFLFPLYIYPEMGLLYHMVVLFLISWGSSMLVFMMTLPIYIPTNKVHSFPFLCFLPLVVSCLFNTSVSPYLIVVLICISWWPVMTSFFSCTCWPSVCSLWKSVYSNILPIF